MLPRIYLIFIFLCKITNLAAYPTPDYEFYFGEDYAQARDYCSAKRYHFQLAGRLTGTDPALLTAILFPEVLRYSLVRDALETRVVSLLYVEYGTEAADFSIGQFQMRPSFAEQLEAEILKNEPWAAVFRPLVTFPESDAAAIRRIRIERLEQSDWQLFYACALCWLVEVRFGKSSEFQALGAVRFTAAAYNGGFRKTAAQIAQVAALAQFPYGKDSPPDNQHPYSLVAEDYYRRYAMKLF